MSETTQSVLLIVVFTLVGGFFVGAETALVALRESQAQKLADRGARGRRLARLVGDPNRFLAAVQFGITIFSFLAAGYGAAQIAPDLEPWLMELGLSEGVANTVAFFAVTLVIAYFTLVIGELVPKRLALRRVEEFSLAVAAPIDVISTLFRPFIWVLSTSTDAVLRLFGIRSGETRESISGEELRGIVAMHQELTAQERELIEDVFDAGERELREVMVPRTEVQFLDGAMSIDSAAGIVLDLPHTRYPVIRGSADDVIGFVHLRDIVVAHNREHSNRRPLSLLCRDVLQFPGTKKVIPALSEMRAAGQHLALVLDEYGGTAGIVTLEDLVEELVGDIRDEYDTDGQSTATMGRSMEVDGLTNTGDFASLTGLRLPEGPYETVAGFVVAEAGELPVVGTSVMFEGHRLSVVELDGRRVSRVLVEPPDPTEPSSSELPE